MVATIYDASRNPIPLTEEIGRGGSGVVYRAGNGQAAKIMNVQPPAALIKKWGELRLLLEQSGDKGVSFVPPAQIFYNGAGDAIGYLMPEIEGARDLRYFCDYKRRGVHFPKASFGTQARVAQNIAAAVARLGRLGVVDGDLKPEQFLIVPSDRYRLYRVDLDGVSFGPFRSQAHTVHYTEPHPEALDKRTPLFDRFSLAVLIYEILCGQRPFFGRGMPADQISSNSWTGKISRREWNKKKGLLRARLILPKEIFALFEQAFDDGFHNRKARPTASQWQQALRGLQKDLRLCSVGHVHAKSRQLCFACAEKSRLGTDIYPSSSLIRP